VCIHIYRLMMMMMMMMMVSLVGMLCCAVLCCATLLTCLLTYLSQMTCYCVSNHNQRIHILIYRGSAVIGSHLTHNSTANPTSFSGAAGGGKKVMISHLTLPLPIP
jgi:hypothetical protein